MGLDRGVRQRGIIILVGEVAPEFEQIDDQDEVPLARCLLEFGALCEELSFHSRPWGMQTQVGLSHALEGLQMHACVHGDHREGQVRGQLRGKQSTGDRGNPGRLPVSG